MHDAFLKSAFADRRMAEILTKPSLTSQTGRCYSRFAVGRAASAVRRAVGLARLHFSLGVSRLSTAEPTVAEC